MRIEDIETNEQEIIDKIKGSKYYRKLQLYRGTNLLDNKDLDYIKLNIPNSGIRKKPLDTKMYLHNNTNDIANKKLGYLIRNGLFAARSELIAEGYGEVVCVFLLDNSKVFFTTVEEYKDFFTLSDDLDDIVENYDTFLSDLEATGRKGVPIREYIFTTLSKYVDSMEELSLSNIEKAKTKEHIIFGEVILTTREFAEKHSLI